MNNEVKYVIRGASLAILVIVSLIIISSYISSKLFTAQEPIAVNNTKKDSIHIITNIEGRNLFKENCFVCHPITYRDGFMIRRVEDRVKDRALLREWIRNSNKVLQSGNPYFNNLVKEYGDVRMPHFPQLTNEQIDAILDYIKEVEQ